MRDLQFGHRARPELAIRAGRRRSVLRRRAGRDRRCRGPLCRRRRRRAGRGRLRLLPAAIDCRIERRRRCAANHLECGDFLQGRLRRRRGGVRQGGACSARRSVDSSRRRPFDGGRGILAQISDRETAAWASTQKAHDLRTAFADYIDLDESRLRVATPDVGGGFGPKLCVYPEDVAVVAAATLLGRSVKWIGTAASISPTRRRSATSTGRSACGGATAACAAARPPHPRHRRLCAAGREHPVQFRNHAHRTLYGAGAGDGCGRGATNKAPVSSVRGAGYPQAAFAMERMMDRLARKSISTAPNCAAELIPAEKMPYLKPLKARSGEQVQYDSGDYPGCQAEILDRWLGRFSAPPGRSPRAAPLYRDRTCPRHQRHRPRPIRIRQCARVADRTHYGLDRGRPDGPGSCHRAGADLRRAFGVRARMSPGLRATRRRRRSGSAASPAGRR